MLRFLWPLPNLKPPCALPRSFFGCLFDNTNQPIPSPSFTFHSWGYSCAMPRSSQQNIPGVFEPRFHFRPSWSVWRASERECKNERTTRTHLNFMPALNSKGGYIAICAGWRSGGRVKSPPHKTTPANIYVYALWHFVKYFGNLPHESRDHGFFFFHFGLKSRERETYMRFMRNRSGFVLVENVNGIFYL